MAGGRKSMPARNTSSKEFRLKTVTVASGAVVTEGSDVLLAVEGYEQCVGKVYRIYKNREKDVEAFLRVYWYYVPEDTRNKRQTYHAKEEIFLSQHSDIAPADSVLWTCAVLPMPKYVAYQNFMNRRDGKAELSGPVAPDPNFCPAVDLSPCRDLCELEPLQHNGLGSRKRKQSEDGDGKADTDNTNGSVESGENRVRNGAVEPTNGKGPVLSEDNGSSEEEDEKDYEMHNKVFLCRGKNGGEYDYVGGRFKDCTVSIYCQCNMPYNPDKPMIDCLGCFEWYHTDCITRIRGSDKWMNFLEGRTSQCVPCQAKRSGGDEDSDDFEEN